MRPIHPSAPSGSRFIDCEGNTAQFEREELVGHLVGLMAAAQCLVNAWL
jgi:hypothetical protein